MSDSTVSRLHFGVTANPDAVRCVWCGLEDHAGNCPVRRVHDVSRRWRELAAIWDRQERESYWPRVRGIQQPPERGRAGIRNWVNWLNNCADEIDATVADTHRVTKERAS